MTGTNRWEVLHGDCLDVMRGMADASVDAVVSDPPYGLSFMGKAWDHGVPGVPFWVEALRVAKPGAHLLAFGGTRTFHRLAVAIEDAGWEIRDDVLRLMSQDEGFRALWGTLNEAQQHALAEVLNQHGMGGCLAWNYGTGFPKSHNLDGPHEGWGTALKPAWEPIIVARKPLVGTVARNVGEFGTGALNIDGTRIATDGPSPSVARRMNAAPGESIGATGWVTPARPASYSEQKPGEALGRWPANVILDEDAAAALDAQTGTLKSGSKREYDAPNGLNQVYGKGMGGMAASVASEGGASRFFYVAKASRSERNAGLGDPGPRRKRNELGAGDAFGNGWREGNTHPTVKPVDVMRWLCRLVTPPNGIVLDPFTGSGTTGVAALREGFRFVGIEREAQYVEIARARIAATRQGNLFASTES